MSKSGYSSRGWVARVLQVRGIRGVSVDEYIRNLRRLSKKLDEERAESAARIFSALSDPARIKIFTLLTERSVCVCELVTALKMRQPAVSYHLKILQGAGLVKSKKVGRWVFYEVSDKRLAKGILRILEGF